MRVIAITFLISISFAGLSCDVCEVFDYASNDSRSNLRLIYGYRFLQGYENGPLHFAPNFLKHQPLNPSLIFEDSEYDFELYQRLEIRYSHLLKGKWLIYGSLPMQRSAVHYEKVYEANLPVFDTTAHMTAFGDLSLGLMRVKTNKTLRRMDNLRYGVQIHAPSGKYSTSSSYFSPRDYAGRGVWSYQLKLNYSATIMGKWGIQAAGYFQSYAQGPPTAAGGFTYNFGKRGSSDLGAFYVTGSINKLIIMTGTSFYLEGKDKVNGDLSTDTGSMTTYVKNGIEWRCQKIGVRSVLLIPFVQKINGTQLRTQAQIQVGFQYFIPSKDKEVCTTE